jgi:ribonuclease P protein component
VNLLGNGLKKSYRLTRSEDIQRVRRDGKSQAHPTMIIGSISNQAEKNRVAVIAGRSVGGAVQRNFAKRRLRSAVQKFYPQLKQGYDLVIIARRPLLETSYGSLVKVMETLLARSELLEEKDC